MQTVSTVCKMFSHVHVHVVKLNVGLGLLVLAKKPIRNAIAHVLRRRCCALTAGIARMGIVNPLIVTLTNIKPTPEIGNTTAKRIQSSL